jgi:hypothetical protein
VHFNQQVIAHVTSTVSAAALAALPALAAAAAVAYDMGMTVWHKQILQAL